jgi:hypothetical protein
VCLPAVAVAGLRHWHGRAAPRHPRRQHAHPANAISGASLRISRPSPTTRLRRRLRPLLRAALPCLALLFPLGVAALPLLRPVAANWRLWALSVKLSRERTGREAIFCLGRNWSRAGVPVLGLHCKSRRLATLVELVDSSLVGPARPRYHPSHHGPASSAEVTHRPAQLWNSIHPTHSAHPTPASARTWLDRSERGILHQPPGLRLRAFDDIVQRLVQLHP